MRRPAATPLIATELWRQAQHAALHLSLPVLGLAIFIQYNFL
jgi:hypothetical protein